MVTAYRPSGCGATQDIAPGQQLAVPVRFTVGKGTGTTGTLQIAVTDTFDKPVLFTGRL